MSSTSKASQRINALLDDNSFVEIGAFVTARATDFDLKQTPTPSDGVITGYGVIDGNPVYVYSQDASVLNGTIGEKHNTADFTNTYNEIPLTGVIINALPYVLMMVVAAGALALYVAAKRRRCAQEER